MSDTRLYEVLGVQRGAAESEIKRAYHALAKQFHPDRNPSADPHKFKEISYAYDVLSDPSKREIYDRYGLRGLQEGGGGPSSAEDLFGAFAGGGLFSELFGGGGGLGGPGGMFFGGGGGGGGGGRRQRRGEDTMRPLRVTLADLYNGHTYNLPHTRKASCSDCNASGSRSGKGGKVCGDCKGSGVKMGYRQLGPGLVQQLHTVCGACTGQGSVIQDKDKCRGCDGKKVREETKQLEIQVERGMSHGMKILMKGQGDEEPGILPGDLHFVVQQEEHPVFSRSGSNLVMERTLSLTEALCGFSFLVEHLDGRQLVVQREKGDVVANDAVHMVLSEGMPMYSKRGTIGDERGHLLIKFKVEFPTNHWTGEKELKLLESLLPPRPAFSLPASGDTEVEEADLHDYEESSRQGGMADSDDDDEQGGGGARVGCAQQ